VAAESGFLPRPAKAPRGMAEGQEEEEEVLRWGFLERCQGEKREGDQVRVRQPPPRLSPARATGKGYLASQVFSSSASLYRTKRARRIPPLSLSCEARPIPLGKRRTGRTGGTEGTGGKLWPLFSILSGERRRGGERGYCSPSAAFGLRELL